MHGQDNSAKLEVARFIDKGGLASVILHEQANQGSSTIIEKFERNSEVTCAIVLMTGDDEGKLAGSDSSYKRRARQNVIFELGYFIAKLGAKRVLALYEDCVELPSDISGVLYIKLDADGAWKMQVAKEFRAMEIVFDLQSAL